MAASENGEYADDVVKPLPRAVAGDGSRRSAGAPRPSRRPGSTGAEAMLRARQVGRSQSAQVSVVRGDLDPMSRPRWTDIEPKPARTRFEPPITGDARYDSLIRMMRRRRNPPREASPTPRPGLPRASARRGTMAGGGTGPGESGRRLVSYPVQPTPTPALKGIVASAAPPVPSPGRPVPVVASSPGAVLLAPSPHTCVRPAPAARLRPVTMGPASSSRGAEIRAATAARDDSCVARRRRSCRVEARDQRRDHLR